MFFHPLVALIIRLCTYTIVRQHPRVAYSHLGPQICGYLSSLPQTQPVDIRTCESQTLLIYKTHLQNTLLFVDKVPSYYSIGSRFANIGLYHTQLRLDVTRSISDKPTSFQSKCCSITPMCLWKLYRKYCYFFPLLSFVYFNEAKVIIREIRNILAPGINPILLVDLNPDHLLFTFIWRNLF